MSKKLHFKSLLLVAAMLFGVSSAWADEVTDVLNRAFTGNTTSTYGNFSGLSASSGAIYAGNNAGSNESIQLRSNNNNSGIVTTSSGGKVKKIVVEWHDNTTDGRTLNVYGSNTAYTDATDLYNSSKQGTLLGTIVKGKSTELTVSGDYTFIGFRSDSGAMYLKEVSITWETSGEQTPSISANNVDITYDGTSGNITSTINNSVSDGVLSADINEGDWLTLGTVTGNTIPFTCSANTETAERTATVTLTYTYGNNETVTKNVTITQDAAPVVYTTIPSMFSAATSTATDVKVTFDNWVVSGVSTNGKNVFVTDGTNGFVIYDNSGGLNNTYVAGSILSGTAVSCKLVLFNGFAEITNLDASDLTIATGGTVSKASVALADLAGVNTGALVSYQNLTCSVNNNKYYLTDGTTTLQVFNSLYAFDALEDGKTYNITGIYQQYNKTKEIMPRSAADIEEVEIQHEQYTLTVSGLENVNTFVFAGDESEMTFEGEGSAQVYDGTEVMVSIDTDEGYALQSLLVDGVEHKDDITGGMYIFTMPTNNVTVTATAVKATTYTLATSITSGKHYVIAGVTDIEIKVMGGQNSNNRAAVDGTVSEASLSVANATEFVIYGPDANGHYEIYDANEGYLYAASSSSNHLKSQKKNNGNGKWSISFDAESSAASIVAQGTNSRNVMQYNSGSTLFSCYASASQGSVYLYEKDGEATPTETVHVTDAKYATYCSENALDFSNTGLTAYIAKINDGTNVTFEPVTKVPAHSGVLLKADAEGDFTVNVATTVDNVTGNALIGVNEQTTVNESGIFVLLNGDSGVGFYKTTANAFTVGAHTAYIPALPNSSRDFIAVDETTAIKAVESQQQDGEIYNMAGQRVAKAQKGLYIIGGKKVVIK